MARSYGQIMSAIWNDPDFRALDCESQRVYLMLVTQAEISSAGTIAMTLKRWSQYAVDSTSDSLSDSLSRLEAERFIATDGDTEELVVRSFVKWDGGANNGKRQPSILAAAHAVVSPKIRAVLAVELSKLELTHSLSDRASDSPRVVVTLLEEEPQPTTLIPQPVSVTARGERLSADWKPSEELIEWARHNGIADTLARSEHLKFIDYWQAQPGAKGRKADWPATWRNWMRTAQERTPAARTAANGSTTDRRVSDALALADRLDRKAIG